MPTLYDVLDETIGTDPPTSLDIDTLIVRSRSGVRRRRWTGTGVAVGVLSLVAFAVVTTTGLPVPGRGGATPGGRGPIGPSTEVAQRLQQAMWSAVLGTVPAVSAVGFDGRPPFEVGYSEVGGFPVPQAAGLWLSPMPLYRGGAVLSRDDTSDQISIVIGWGRTVTIACPVAIPDECEERTGPNGEAIVTQRIDKPSTGQVDGHIPFFIYQVWVSRPDGSYVFVSSEPTAGLPSDLTVAVLTRRDVESIALNSALTPFD